MLIKQINLLRITLILIIGPEWKWENKKVGALFKDTINSIDFKNRFSSFYVPMYYSGDLVSVHTQFTG